ncbi:hypothetical protein BJ508DRAFT_313567 [Ascobolus immersus RN42]|uniref:Uncharacterized protein n=1 Tax=Ascobolus immersus RN42 TaxID=1160509 RepID=A0A3N4HMF8_ASCIM|nr:hypothetical protein BJ508DRAFT_313567 [Ascobolus immersus RN42]
MPASKGKDDLKARLFRLETKLRILNRRVEILNERMRSTQEARIAHLESVGELGYLAGQNNVHEPLPHLLLRSDRVTKNDIDDVEKEVSKQENWFTNYRREKIFVEMEVEGMIESAYRKDNTLLYKTFDYGMEHGFYKVTGQELDFEQKCAVLEHTLKVRGLIQYLHEERPGGELSLESIGLCYVEREGEVRTYYSAYAFNQSKPGVASTSPFDLLGPLRASIVAF